MFQDTTYLENIKDDKICNKILILRQFENDNNIKPFNVNFINDNIKINITDENFKLIKNIFRISKNKPSTYDELKQMYVGMLRHLFNSLEIIQAKQTKNKDRKNIKIYSLNDKLIKQLFNLAFKLRIENLDTNLLTSVGIIHQNYI
jgi:hypothetical protein